MASVSAEIRRLLRSKDARIADGEQALRGLLVDVKRQIIAELQTVDSAYAGLKLRQQLASIERYLEGFRSFGTAKMDELLDAAWSAGADLTPAAMRVGGLHVGFFHLPGPVLETMKDYAYHKISGLAEDAFTKIRGELSLGILGQKTPHEVVQGIAGSLGSPGVFASLEARADVIAGVEMGRAYSTATQASMQQARTAAPGLKKQWWHAGHPKRPRQNHLALHGQVRPVDEYFVIGSLAMMHPRDSRAPASEVIRCGCDHVPWHESWDIDDKLPIYNERGEEITSRGERRANDSILTGKFAVGQIKAAASACSHGPGCGCCNGL